MTDKFSSNFLNDLFRTAFRSKNIFEILQAHLEFHYLPSEEYKEVWKTAKVQYELFNELPTIGILAEKNKDNVAILSQLNRIREAEIIPENSLIKELETFLKDVMFIDLYEKIGNARKDGKKEEALKILKSGNEKISSFSLSSQLSTKVFKGFGERYNERSILNASKGQEAIKKASWGIECLDNRHYGGVDYGDTAVIIALSNVGKSPCLKHIGYSNAISGKRVLHIQVEGTKREAEDSYDAMMAASSLNEIETTSLPQKIVDALIKNSSKVEGEIDVIAFEQFGSVTMNDVRNCVSEYVKQNGHLDVLVLDYIDKIDPANGKRYSTNIEGEKARRSALADLFKNLCMEFMIAGFTATQASDVADEKKNDPKFYLSRSDIRGDKNFLDPFSYGVTLNQTLDEKSNEVMRLKEEKCRKYGFGYKHDICTAYKNSRFYDRKRTINMFGE